LYEVEPLGLTLRESKILHAVGALGRPVSTALARPIWRFAGYPVAEEGYPLISPTTLPSTVSIAGELHARSAKVGKVAA